MEDLRETRHEWLAKISIMEVASIAAHLPTKTPAIDAVRRAYELLEWAAAGKEGFDHEYDPCAERGLLHELSCLEYEKKRNEKRAGALKGIWQNEGYLPYPREDVLKNLMGPYPKVDRLPRFTWWLMDLWNISEKKATRFLEAWSTDGVPDDIYRRALETFDGWWIEREKKRFSKQGITTQEKRRAAISSTEESPAPKKKKKKPQAPPSTLAG